MRFTNAAQHGRVYDPARRVWQMNSAAMSVPVRERRKHRRKVLITNATVEVDGASRPCRVLNISAEGAHLALDQTSLPERFVLLLSANGSVRRLCDLVWRNDDEIGVRFVRGAAEPSRLPAGR
jgi:hypothetical protein